MFVVETVVRIRREHASGKAIKVIARDLRLSRKVVRKAIRSPEAFNYQRTVQPLICLLLSGPKLMIFWISKEIMNAEQEASPGRYYRQAACSGGCSGAGCDDRRSVSPDRGQREDLLSVAQGIWRTEDRSGAANEEHGERERAGGWKSN